MASDKLKIDTRRSRIIEILDRTGRVKVGDLSLALGATPVTIRSDLDALERDGYLERVPGGAIQTSLNYATRTFQNKKNHFAEEKIKIAAVTANLIHDGDTIFINSGTTTYSVAARLKNHKNLKIVTNSFYVAMELGATPTFDVILLGGELNARDTFTYGNDALEQLRRYRANYAILSIDGVCPDSGISTLHAEEVLVERAMMERAKETIIVADSSKLGREGFLYVCDAAAIHKLVTVKSADPAFVRRMKEKKVKVYQG